MLGDKLVPVSLWIDLRSNLSVRDDQQMTKSLSHGTVTVLYKLEKII
jgi:hypothetical protein